MRKFRPVSTETIYAEQFLPPGKIPDGVMNVRLISVGDTKLYTGQVTTIQGEVVVIKSGEWVVREKQDPSRHYPVADDVFRDKYEPVSKIKTDKVFNNQ